MFDEALRPRFHFTAPTGWLNDPNGMVYYDGEYHLFYQHNPFGTEWGNMHWGHTVSADLVNWHHLPIALAPDIPGSFKEGTAFSGSAVVDCDNSAGFQEGAHKTLLAFYTSQAHGQRLAYSTDKGRTWRKYVHNPLIAQQGDARDPKVFRHDPSGMWVMVVYGEKQFHLYNSLDAKQWVYRSSIDGFYECPDLLELPVDGDEGRKRWALIDGNGQYILGDFDGQRFEPEGEKTRVDYGGNFYATQTFNGMPSHDPRRIQIAWMRGGKYPLMPFSQQMTFPCELTLRELDGRERLCRWPVKEIERLYKDTILEHDIEVNPGVNPLRGYGGELLDIALTVERGDATAMKLILRADGSGSCGVTVAYDFSSRQVSCGAKCAPLPLRKNRLSMRLLLDTTSVELFGNDGEVSISNCFIPPAAAGLYLHAEGGALTIKTLRVSTLKPSMTIAR